MYGTISCVAVIALAFVFFALTLIHCRRIIDREGKLDRKSRENYLLTILGLSMAVFVASSVLCAISCLANEPSMADPGADSTLLSVGT